LRVAPEKLTTTAKKIFGLIITNFFFLCLLPNDKQWRQYAVLIMASK
jgi:hypothetical protein